MPDPSFWASLDKRIGRRTDLHGAITWLFDTLDRGPIAASPLDLENGQSDAASGRVSMKRWLTVWDPADDKLRDLFQHRARHELAYLEGKRITAILSLWELSSGQSNDPYPSRESCLHFIYSWLADIRQMSDQTEHLYYTTWRITDEHTYGDREHRNEDAATLEHDAFLFYGRGSKKILRGIFQDDFNAIMLPIARWHLRRYSFEQAIAILRSGEGASGTRPFLLLQARFLPRLFCSTLVGHFACATQEPVVKLMTSIFSGYFRGGIYTVSALALFVALVYGELRQRVPLRRRHSPQASRISAIGLVQALSVGVVTTWIASVAHPGLEIESAALSLQVGVWIGLSVTALTFGYVLQILWDDKSITDPI